MKYDLVLPFLDESPSFALGFEAGQEYGRMAYGNQLPYDQVVHIENQRQLLLIAELHGWTIRFQPLDETFCAMFATKRRARHG